MEVKLPSLLGMSDRPSEHREVSLPIINMVDRKRAKDIKKTRRCIDYLCRQIMFK